MLRFIIPAAAAIACASPIQAHLWETRAQITARLGRPMRIDKDPTGDVFRYKFEKYRVSVTFLRERSQREVYTHADRKSQLTRREADRILSMNTHGDATWQFSKKLFALIPKGGGHPIAGAAYIVGNKPPYLVLITTEFVKKAGKASPPQFL